MKGCADCPSQVDVANALRCNVCRARRMRAKIRANGEKLKARRAANALCRSCRQPYQRTERCQQACQPCRAKATPRASRAGARTESSARIEARLAFLDAAKRAARGPKWNPNLKVSA